ncbi:ATP-binding protein [Streptomyces armeniacus]|uniref:ATP-binding protein n=2 Tax=Streptomyces armeniacus TaxID=83291 RepID=A0A345Y1G9_9ACTN|nr:ATP-binding protein [Streptomyces armeniacus]
MRFTSTPRSARLARRLTAVRLDQWGIPYDSPVSEAAVLIVAELAGNAVTHGHVRGRNFSLRLLCGPGRLRIEVSDTRTEARVPRTASAPRPDDENGRGLLLVAALATRWGVAEREPQPAPGKTVWAELGH